jgi:hypothetical protein
LQSLLIEMRYDGTLLSTGTGFTVSTPTKTYLITNRHNVTGRRQDNGEPISKTGGIPNEIVIWHNLKGKLFTWSPTRESLTDSIGKRWIEHPTLGARADFVALPLSNIENVDFYSYDLCGPTYDIQIGPGEIISVIGFPFGLRAGGVFGIWSTGFVASEPEVDYDDLPVMLIDCRSRQGQSGSPVIAYKGPGSTIINASGSALKRGPIWRFIGVYSGRINIESDLGMVWKASAIDELIKSIDS